MLVDDAVLVGIKLDLGSIEAEIGQICDRIDGNIGILFTIPVKIKAAPRVHSIRIQVTFVPLVPELEDVEDLGFVQSLIKDQIDVEVVLIRSLVEELIPAHNVDVLQTDNAVEHFVVILERAVEWLKQAIQGLMKRCPVFELHCLKSGRLEGAVIVQRQIDRGMLTLDNSLAIDERQRQRG